jgi:LacI family transcriptional regulator, galactose operon repressor
MQQDDRHVAGAAIGGADPAIAAASSSTTSHDVARAAGVSQPTVSRALRGDPRVAEATRRRVTRAAARLGYVPSDRGRSLSTRRSGRVAVVVDDLDNPFYLELLDALHDRLERANTRMLVLTPHRNDPLRTERLLDGSIDGVVLTTTTLDSRLPAELRARRFPFVLLNRVVDGVDADSCTVDNDAGGGEVARALLRGGHTRIGALFGPPSTSTGRDRERGFRRALADAGAALPDELVRHGPFAFDYGHRGVAELLAASPTAVFCANDVVALGALNAARGLGIAVPDELSIVGFDDISMAGWELIRLTTVRQDLRRMGEIAVELVLDRIADPDRAARRVVLPAELVRRATAR